MTTSIAFKTKRADTKEIKSVDPRQETLDLLTESHATAYGALAAEMVALNQKLQAAKDAHIAALRKLVVVAKSTKASLSDFIAANAPMFDRPRTQQLHGFKVGMRKLEGKMTFDDEVKAVSLIQKHFPGEFDTLVDTHYTISKDAAGRLAAADLKRIGGEISDSVDEVVIKPTAGDVEKLVDALIKERADN